MFSPLVLSHWIPNLARGRTGSGVLVSVDPSLSPNRAVSLVQVADGPAVLSLSPARSGQLDLASGQSVDRADLATRLERAAIALNSPDHLYYLTLRDQAGLRDEAPDAQTRQLVATDASSFEKFTGQAPEADLDEAFVELDHWLVFGTFIGDRLACVASMYPWSGTRLADLGVITLPEFRGRGLGRATVRAMSADALGRGYEPQYRCQFDNAGSVALARAAGLTRFGDWEVIDVDE